MTNKREYRQWHRKPDGKYTFDSKEYIAAWKALTTPLESLGFHVIGFDPNVLFTTEAKNGQSFDLPIEAILRINKALTKTVINKI